MLVILSTQFLFSLLSRIAKHELFLSIEKNLLSLVASATIGTCVSLIMHT